MSDLAMAEAQEVQREPQLSIGLFDAMGFRFGVDIGHLSEVALVDELLPIVSTRPEVMGSLDLRGTIIPVLDPLAMCGFTPRDHPPKMIAVLRNEKRRIGVAVDQTRGISKFSPSALQPLFKDDPCGTAIIRKALLDGGKPVNVIDAKGIFEQLALPFAMSDEDADRKSSGTDLGAFLTFEAGGGVFGLDATFIFGTVPRQTIEPGAVAGTKCLGIIQYLGRQVPVLDCSDVVGLGTGLRERSPEVVVLRMGNDQLVGLAVDVIRRIEFWQRTSLSEVPAYFDRDGSVISSVRYEEPDGQIFVLDPMALSGMETLQKLGQISDTRDEKAGLKNDRSSSDAGSRAQAARSIQVDGKSKMDRTAKRYLTYKAGGRLASELTNVVTILTYPNTVTPFHRQNPAFAGMFSYKQSSVLLVDLSSVLGHGKTDVSQDTRVLIVSQGSGFVGYIVEAVNGIEDSELTYDDADGTRIAKLLGDQVLNVLDLTSTLDRLNVQL